MINSMKRLAMGVATLGLVATMPGIANADWDYTYGDAGPLDYSEFLEVATTPDGGAVLFGAYSGEFEGLSADATYRPFVQYRNSDGIAQWTTDVALGEGCGQVPTVINPQAGADGAVVAYVRDCDGWSIVVADAEAVQAQRSQTGMLGDEPVQISANYRTDPRGGVQILSDSQVFNGGIALVKLDSALDIEWSVDLPPEIGYTEPLFDAPPSNVTTDTGTGWVVGFVPKPLAHLEDSIALVRVEPDGSDLTTIRHFGYGCLGPESTQDATVRAVRATESTVWVYTCEFGETLVDEDGNPDSEPVRVSGILAFDSVDGSLQGRVATPADDADLRAALTSGEIRFSADGRIATTRSNPDVLWRLEGELATMTWERIDLGLSEDGFAVSSVDAIGSTDIIAVGEVGTEVGSSFIGRSSLTVPAAAITRRTLPSLTSFEPVRLLDSRAGQQTIDGEMQGLGRLSAGSVTPMAVRHRGGVGESADSVVINVTAVNPEMNGFLTVFPCGEEQPLTSSLNYTSRVAKGNNVISKIGVDDSVCVFTSAETDLVVDGSGQLRADSGFGPVVPGRLLDTRSTGKTIDGQSQGIGRTSDGDVIRVEVPGRAEVAEAAETAVLNVTAVRPGNRGFVTVWPCGEEQPDASSLNFDTGENVGNSVMSKIGEGGKICVFTSAATDLTIDVSGYFEEGSGFGAVVPARVLETRVGKSTVDGQYSDELPMPADDVIDLQVAGRAGVAEGASLVVLNVTAINPSATGFVTIWPCFMGSGEPPPTSSLNFAAGRTAGNNVISKVSDGVVCVRSSVETELVIDVTGYM